MNSWYVLPGIALVIALGLTLSESGLVGADEVPFLHPQHNAIETTTREFHSTPDETERKNTIAPQTARLKPAYTRLDPFELARYQYCGSDRDCIVITNGCCDCANGGEDVAINAARVEEFRSRFNCLSVTCDERDAVPPCGRGTVACVDHKCRYIPAKSE